MRTLILQEVSLAVSRMTKCLQPPLLDLLIAPGYPKGPLFMNESPSVSVLFLLSHYFLLKPLDEQHM